MLEQQVVDEETEEEDNVENYQPLGQGGWLGSWKCGYMRGGGWMVFEIVCVCVCVCVEKTNLECGSQGRMM